MQRFAWGLFAAAIVVAVAVILGTQGALPDVVASHFAAGGRADRFVTHDVYVALMVAAAVGAPLVVALATTWLPRVRPSALKLDRCRRWANPAARPAILAMTATFGAFVGAMLAAFIAAVHLLVVDAHGRTPPVLDQTRFVTLGLTFAVTMVVACLVHTLRTKRA